MNFKKLATNRLLPVLLAGSPLLGCAASQAPKELVDARSAFSQAETGYAKQYSPAALHEAKTALDSAEAQFTNNGDTASTRDTAYVATRKAQMADTIGSTQHYQRELEAAKQQQGKMEAKNAQATRAELTKTKEQLSQEKNAHAEAERRSNEAFERLAAANAAAAVKHESRGTVITLSGGVLFASGKSVLLPGAQSGLDQVADALKAQEDNKILIEGHTDSKGNDASNMVLSKARAEAVQAYLSSRGVASDRMTSNGLGPSRPVADNASPVGRANNRRVEIVVQSMEPR